MDPDITDPASCRSNQGTWHPQITSAADCLAVKLCKSSKVAGFEVTKISGNLKNFTYFPTGWNNKSEQVCSACEDNWTSVYAVQNGLWKPRAWQNYQWKTRSVENYKWSTTFNSDSFNELLSSARNKYSATIYSTELLCKYGEEKGLLDRLACDCISGQDCSSLLDSTQTTTTGIYRYCEGIPQTVTFAGGHIETTTTFTVSGGLQCVSIKTILVPYQQFELQSTSTIGNVIISGPQTVKSQLLYYTNDNGIVVGRVYGDGVGLSFSDNTSSSDLKTLTGMIVCLTMSLPDPDPYLQYAYVDLALANNDITAFTVLNMQGSLCNSSTCTLCNNYSGGTVIYFPIALRQNYQNSVYYDTWTSSEIIVIWLGLSIYSLLLIMCIYHLYLHYRLLRQQKKKITCKIFMELPRLVLAVIALFLLVRIIFFSIVPFGTLEKSEAINLIFAQLPPLLFLSAYILMLIKWAQIYRAKQMKRRKSLVSVGIATSAALWLFFLVIMILLITLPNNLVQYTCVTPDSAQNQHSLTSIIAITYNSFYAFICFCCAGLFVFYGVSLFSTLQQSNAEMGSGQKDDKNKSLMKLLLIMMVCSCILVIQAMILILESAGLEFKALDRMILIICVEVPPTLTVFVMFSASSALSSYKRKDVNSKTQSSVSNIKLKNLIVGDPKGRKSKSKSGTKPDSSSSTAKQVPEKVTLSMVKNPKQAAGSNEPIDVPLAKPKKVEEPPITLPMVTKPRVSTKPSEKPVDKVASRPMDKSVNEQTDQPEDIALLWQPDLDSGPNPAIRMLPRSNSQVAQSPTEKVTKPVTKSEENTVVNTQPVIKLVTRTDPDLGGSKQVPRDPDVSGLKLVPRREGSGPPPTLKMIPRPESRPVKKRDPLDDQLGPVTLKMVPRASQPRL
eukprot:TRINITY_DN1875_c0_g1_i6.p1 TRINITY_DN1875_c0_g1~~TRINITY_DN1875_c0_g1_i6.p1  ORF type:complete len:1055 (-),score=158.04 TRINITY_DN1875_c0_g1_i6:101-2791(-)